MINFLNTSDVDVESNILFDMIKGFSFNIDINNSLLRYYTSHGALKNEYSHFGYIPYKPGATYVFPKISGGSLYLNHDNINIFLKSLKDNEASIRINVSNFIFHFRNVNVHNYILKAKYILNEPIPPSHNDLNLKLVLEGIKMNEIKSKVDYHFAEINSYLDSELQKFELRVEDDEKVRISRVIKPFLVDAFIKFEEDLIEHNVLSIDKKWIGKPIQLARVIKALDEYEYLRAHNKYKEIKVYLKERYSISYKLIGGDNIFKPNKIHKLKIGDLKLPFFRLTFLKNTPLPR